MASENKQTVVVIDDHPVSREGIAFLIQAEDNFKVVAQASSVEEGLAAIEEHRPDLVVSDLSLRDRSALELIRDALARFPKTLILVISIHDESVYAERVLRAGARGYIMKEAASEELIEASNLVLSGEIYASSSFTSLLVKRLSGNPGAEPEKNSVLQVLSDRELQIFELIGKALSNQAIADRLNISPRTVDAHKTHIKEKLELPDNNAVLRFAVQWLNTGIQRTGRT